MNSGKDYGKNREFSFNGLDFSPVGNHAENSEQSKDQNELERGTSYPKEE